MDTYPVSPAGALLVIVFSLAYLVLFLILQFRLFGRRGKKAEQFCAEAERDGRMVIARREQFRLVSSGDADGSLEYVARYTYTAPNGKQYKMRAQDCQRFRAIPPETITLYLEKGNYRKYYEADSLNLGKHGAFVFLLSWVVGIVVYFNLIWHFIMPLVVH